MNNYYENIIKSAQENAQQMYESDYVYKVLVDNYVKASMPSIIDKRGRKTIVDGKKLGEALNALAAYKAKLNDENRIIFFEKLNLNANELNEMFKKGIINTKTIKNMWLFKIGKYE